MSSSAYEVNRARGGYTLIERMKDSMGRSTLVWRLSIYEMRYHHDQAGLRLIPNIWTVALNIARRFTY